MRCRKKDILFSWLASFIFLTTDLYLSDVCTKYQEAAKIVNLALQGLVSQCVPGAKILDLCEFGHTVITAQSQKLFTKKVDGRTIDRGVAFPICISVNDIVCNHSPLPTEETVSHSRLCQSKSSPVWVNPSAIRLYAAVLYDRLFPSRNRRTVTLAQTQLPTGRENNWS